MRPSAVAVILIGALVSVAVVHAQDPPPPTQAPVFEAASVKEHITPGDGSFVGRRPGGRFAAENASLREIIEYAYQLQGFQLVGSLAPVDGARWDITAALGGAGGASRSRRHRPGGTSAARRSLRPGHAPRNAHDAGVRAATRAC